MHFPRYLTLFDVNLMTKIYYDEYRIKKKAQNGTLILTTHRIIWYREHEGLHIPLFYIKDYKAGVSIPSTSIFFSILNHFSLSIKFLSLQIHF